MPWSARFLRLVWLPSFLGSSLAFGLLGEFGSNVAAIIVGCADCSSSGTFFGAGVVALHVNRGVSCRFWKLLSCVLLLSFPDDFLPCGCPNCIANNRTRIYQVRMIKLIQVLQAIPCILQKKAGKNVLDPCSVCRCYCCCCCCCYC